MPTKNDWHDDSDIKLIERSCIEMVEIADKNNLQTIYMQSSPKKCVNCSQLKMILSCRLLGHLFDDLFMIVVVGKHIEHTAACAPFIMLIDQD